MENISSSNKLCSNNTIITASGTCCVMSVTLNITLGYLSSSAGIRRMDCASACITTLTMPPQRRPAVMCAAVDLISGSPGTIYDLWVQFPVIEPKLVFLPFLRAEQCEAVIISTVWGFKLKKKTTHTKKKKTARPAIWSVAASLARELLVLISHLSVGHSLHFSECGSSWSRRLICCSTFQPLYSHVYGELWDSRLRQTSPRFQVTINNIYAYFYKLDYKFWFEILSAFVVKRKPLVLKDKVLSLIPCDVSQLVKLRSSKQWFKDVTLGGITYMIKAK